MVVHAVVPLKGLHRHDQPGYFSLAELPQRPSIETVSQDSEWWEFDQIFRLYPGQFTIVTGVAGHGKSTFLLNLICGYARKHGTRSFLYVPENEQHLCDKLRGIWGDRDGFGYFCSDQCYIQSAMPDRYDERPHTLSWVLEKALVAIERDNVDLLLIDPWNELERAKPREQLMTDYIGECLMYLKGFCRSMGVATILVAHPTKAGIEAGKAPGLADIEGSMNWYNKCDNGLIVAREADKNNTKVISAKVRENGAGKRGVCWFTVDPKTGIFTPQHGAVT